MTHSHIKEGEDNTFILSRMTFSSSVSREYFLRGFYTDIRTTDVYSVDI
jgi:hypothetical protein